MSIYQLDQHVPRLDSTAWVADSAQIIGLVALAANTSVWFGAVLRGDTDQISIGAGSVAPQTGRRVEDPVADDPDPDDRPDGVIRVHNPDPVVVVVDDIGRPTWTEGHVDGQVEGRFEAVLPRIG